MRRARATRVHTNAVAGPLSRSRRKSIGASETSPKIAFPLGTDKRRALRYAGERARGGTQNQSIITRGRCHESQVRTRYTRLRKKYNTEYYRFVSYTRRCDAIASTRFRFLLSENSFSDSTDKVKPYFVRDLRLARCSGCTIIVAVKQSVRYLFFSETKY